MIYLLGGSGYVGHAYQAMLARKGVPFRNLRRAELDYTDGETLRTALLRDRPDFLINAAGYRRVDEAEADAEACRQVNVAGAVNLAAACRRRGLPLVTFSSDLVFSGRERRPYVEDDSPQPLNAYGAAKAEMERRVRELGAQGDRIWARDEADRAELEQQRSAVSSELTGLSRGRVAMTAYGVRGGVQAPMFQDRSC